MAEILSHWTASATHLVIAQPLQTSSDLHHLACQVYRLLSLGSIGHDEVPIQRHDLLERDVRV